jgi:PAS domain S-box-containing protein
MLKIWTLGGLSIRHHGEPVARLAADEKALLVYLACTGQPCPREALAELLSREGSQESAPHSLDLALAGLRKRVGDSLVVTPKTIALNPEAGLWLDIAELQATLGAGKTKQAVELYRGPFLEGFSSFGAAAFDNWLAERREQLHGTMVDALQDIVAHHIASGDLRTGITHAARLLDLAPSLERDPWREKLWAAVHHTQASSQTATASTRGGAGAPHSEAERWRTEREQVQAERERLLAATRAQAARQAALFRLSAELAAALDEAEICRRVVDGLKDTLGYDVLAVMLVDETTGNRVLASSIGFVEPMTPVSPGQGLSERPLLDGQLHYTPDVSQDPRYIHGMGGSEVDVPVQIGGEVLGVLVAESRRPHAFGQEDFEVLTAAAQQAGLAIGKARLLASERKRADELDALRTTLADITAELELSALLQTIVERAAVLLDATGGELGLYDEATQEIQVVVSSNLGEDYVGVRHALGQGAMGRAAQVRKPFIIDDYQTWDGRLSQYSQVHAVLVTPLEVGGRFVGVFTTASTDPARQFTDADLHLLRLFAQQASIAIENARLYEQSQKELTERARVEAELRTYQEHLEDLVEARTAELWESEARYRTLFDGIPIGLYRTTPEGQIVDANLAQAQMLGYPSREALLAINSSRLYVDSEDRLRWQALMERDGLVRDFQIRFRCHGGSAIWVNDTARAVRDDEGKVLYYEGSIEDITERIRAEAELHRYQEHLEELVADRTAELRESEERYRTLFDGVPVGLYRTTPEGKILVVNQAAVQMLDLSGHEDALLTMDTRDLYVDPQDRTRWQALMERDGIVRDFETQLYRHDGTVIWVNDSARAVKDEQDRVLYYEGSLEDISERKGFEEEIRRQKEYYEALFVNNPVAVVTADLDGNIVSWNPMAEKLFAYTQEEVIGRNLDDLVANDDSIHAEAVGYQDEVISVGRVQATTKRTRKDGSLVDVELLALPVVVAEERVGFIAIYHDISERKKFEEELRHQKEYYEALFVNSPVAVVTADLNGDIVSWNPMAEKLFGYTQEEVIGTSLDDAVANQDSLRPEAAGYTQQAINVGRVQVTTRRTRRDGSLVDVELLALPVVVAGEKVGFIAIYHDISARKTMERELRWQKEYYEALFVNNPGAVVTVDLTGSVVSWNPAAERLFGYEQREVIGKKLDALVANEPGIREEAVAYTKQVSTMGRVQATTHRTRRDGSLVDVEVLALPVIVGEQNVGSIGIYIDITDLQKARRDAEAASRAKSAFLANMSHELRTPLNVILGFTQLMDRDPNLTPDQLEHLGIIGRSGEHLLALINDVLEVSKIEAGKLLLQEKSFDLYRQLDGLEEILGLRAQEKGLKLTVTHDEHVPQYVVTDEGKLAQVLSNLLGNAIKFTQEGSVMLRVTTPLSTQPSESGHRLLRFEVEDTGPGIAPEELPTIFDAFVQSETGRQTQEGTGLGLTISRQFVHLMGGDLTATSQLGQGSCFQFEVQVGLAPSEATEMRRTPHRQRVIGIEPDPRGAAGGPYRLLVADDREVSRQLLVKLLEPVGFEIQVARNGQEAIEVWEAGEPHLIWMDMRMPVMDGYEATRRIKATRRGQNTVIIALTASAFAEDREEILSAGCDDFVRKPFRENELFDMLAKHLGVRFIYEDAESALAPQVPEHPVPQDDDAELVRRLAALPGEWLASLQEATTLGELHLILGHIARIHERDPELAGALAALARDFEHERILIMLQMAGEGS